MTLLIASQVTGITIDPGMGAGWLGGGTNPVLAGGATSGLQVTITFVLNDGTTNRFICG